MKRGDVYDARLDPVRGSEQGGSRPVVIVSRDAINASSPVVLAVPCTTWYTKRRVYPSHLLIRAMDGGLDVDSVALCEQLRAIDRGRLQRQRGTLAVQTLADLDNALLITLGLTGR